MWLSFTKLVFHTTFADCGPALIKNTHGVTYKEVYLKTGTNYLLTKTVIVRSKDSIVLKSKNPSLLVRLGSVRRKVWNTHICVC